MAARAWACDGAGSQSETGQRPALPTEKLKKLHLCLRNKVLHVNQEGQLRPFPLHPRQRQTAGDLRRAGDLD